MPRKLFMILFLCLSVCFISSFFLGCTGDDDDDDNDDNGANTLVPIQVGAIWHYALSSPNGNSTITYTANGYTTKNGINTFQVTGLSTDTPNVTSWTETTYWVIENDDIKQYLNDIEMVYPSSTVGFVENIFSPYQLIYPSKSSVASTSQWTGNGTISQMIFQDGVQIGSMDYSYALTLDYVGKETKTVAAGTFNDCYKFNRHFVLTAQGVTIDVTATFWVKDGVGMIYTTSNQNGAVETRELTGYTL